MRDPHRVLVDADDLIDNLGQIRALVADGRVDGWLSIEHEDVVLSRLEGARRSVELLKAVVPRDVSDFELQAI